MLAPSQEWSESQMLWHKWLLVWQQLRVRISFLGSCLETWRHHLLHYCWRKIREVTKGPFFASSPWNPLSSSECCLCCLEKHSRFGWATREALRKDRFSITPYVWRRRDFSGWQRWSQDGKDKKKEALARWLQIKQKESLFREYNQMRHHCRALNSF